MKAYMTSGTIDYLLKIQEKYKSIDFFFIISSEGAIAFYESTDDKVFASGREYEVLKSIGNIQEHGYVIMNHIPVSEDSHATFEYRMKHSSSGIEKMPGFQAMRLLKQTDSNMYVVFTQWASKDDFNNWKESDHFKQAHKDQQAKKPGYIMERPFIITGTMYEEDN
ncbi:hypothetical conserved protein [Oceanobacillus iheyensis HTE831]|uniref:Hypothetical conserved protein n=1 Tax=Oceanobacillus iheyensis (strain DSM 14371 / CIP 107618 / JCM 11309 / KCTC 3954 / HTE831) TaxID=221109 RepID=Q8ERY1_OCEIH|nr:antibiotic biosynthesis monooxygenase [Oceanobacillus iheyensis]BAC13121.1 hypothetical conserved protein [Oceanobacillus iheyensis HTE831]